MKFSPSTGLSTSREYDAVGRLIAETDVLGRTTRYAYYADGKRKNMIDPRGNVFTFEYDARGHQTAMRFPDGSSVSYAYNEQGKKVSETDQLGHTKSFVWNDLGLLQEITDPLGHRTRYNYNEIGNLLSQTDANNHTTSFAYNKLGRRTKKTYPLGMSQTTSYDVANRRVSVTDFNGETTTSQYDTLGRVVTTIFPDGGSQSYSYTTSGQIAAVTDRHGTTEYQYDSDERLTSVTDANGATISYSYDAFGRTQTVTTPSGTTGYGYDTYGRLTNVTDPDGAETRYTYDEHGNKANMIYPNGTITECGYDTLNRLISVETRTITNDLLAAYSYTLNAKGQRTHVEEQPIGRVIDYEYDAADRLIAEHISDPVLGNRTISYTYDPVGNRLAKDDNGVVTEYVYDDNDRLLTENEYAYTYDDNGNLLTKIGNGEEWQLTYNALNHVEHADISTSQGTSSLAYTYDHDGIRIGKTINGTEVVQYVVDKNRPYAQVLEETHTRGGLSATTSYVYGDALISAATEGSTHYYHTDGLGSVRHLSDASGALTDSYTYDAYGLLTTSRGTTVNPYRYRGEQYDADLDAYYLRARYYQPETGRFLTTDPFQGVPTTPMSLHRYLYGNANPVSMIDPSGRMSLNEILVVATEVSILSGITMGITEASGLGNPYSWLAENVLPEAYIIGFNVTGTIPPPLRWYLEFIIQQSPTALDFPEMFSHSTISRGGELVLSLGSGEAAWFITNTFGAVWTRPNLSVGVELYDGWVYNLWNAGDYTGPFQSLSLNSDLGKIEGGWSLFWDAPRGPTRGPWGIASTFLSKSFPKLFQPFSVAKSFVDYSLYKKPLFLDRPAVITAIYTMLFASKLIEAIDHGGADAATQGLWLVFETSMWANIGVAHHFWNLKEPLYNLEHRRDYKKDRPDEFHSGPNIGWLSLSNISL